MNIKYKTQIPPKLLELLFELKDLSAFEKVVLFLLTLILQKLTSLSSLFLWNHEEDFRVRLDILIGVEDETTAMARVKKRYETNSDHNGYEDFTNQPLKR